MNSQLSWKIKNKKPFLISGPCSAETEDQVMEVAQALKKTGHLDLFRSGIWKPRTRPGAFEGVGEIGLAWLQRVKNELNLPVTVEIATAKHVEKSLKAGIDVLWIGARTTVNPFAVQEIADALKGTNVPVMIKNPVNPDLGLWIGATERILGAGIETIAAIHRGFSISGEKMYRNKPYWHIAIDYHQHFPQIPLINDPSHICGRRDLLFQVAQKAMDLEYDGLMLESHPNPDQAWSDAAQQVTPHDYKKIIDELVIRKRIPDASTDINALEKLRHEIDAIDDELLLILSSRMDIVRKIGSLKRSNQITILQHDRWLQIFKKFISRGLLNGLSEDFLNQLVKAIHDESIAQQERIMNNNHDA